LSSLGSQRADMQNRLCSRYPEAKVLCDYLKHDESLYVNEILDHFLNNYDIGNLAEHNRCMEANCGLNLFHRLLGFMKLFKDVPSFRIKINSPEFPAPVLEQLIVYTLALERHNGKNTAYISDNYFEFIEPDKMIQVISDTDMLDLEPEFVLHSLSRFGNRYMDKLLARSEGIRKLLTKLFLESEEKEVKSILSVNPIIYDYLMMFLELEGRNEEAGSFHTKYGEVYENARLIQNQVDQIKSNIKEYKLPLALIDRGERILFILEKIADVEDKMQSYLILVSNNAFIDDREKDMIKMILRDPDMQTFLKLH
jgi:hypothetical protein